jgi:predicted nuclease of predicted toxin-antitoxin system
LRFLIDESLPGDLASDLMGAGHDVLDVAGSGHRGAADAVIWRIAIAERRVAVVRDLDFPLPKHLGRPPGLVVMRPHWNARAEQIRHLFAEFLARVDLASLEGAVTTVEPGRYRQRRYDDLPW